MPEPVIDSAKYRQVLGHFPTGVCVMAAFADAKPVGMAIGSFFSISLDPPLVGFCAGKGSSTWPKIRDSGKFCASILGADQEEVCRRFASKEQDKFAGLAWDHSPLDSPRLGGSLAWVDCTIEQVVDAGDHEIAIGRVHDLDVAAEGHPLVFFRGGYAEIS
jgi:3-hydroxy-9,10-secoandrosta-1,3,5(10)-triene-9,17-dione monooxygenase reductase component